MDRLSACPLTIHALLHIADSIKATGPVWCYWAFPMEQYCGVLKPGFQSRRFPYASLDHFVIESAQLTQVEVIYDVAEKLALRPSKRIPSGAYIDPSCMLTYPLLVTGFGA